MLKHVLFLFVLPVVINKHEQMVFTFTRPRALTIKGAQRFEKEYLCFICKRYVF